MDTIVSMAAINAARRRLPFLENAETMLCEDGIRYTFFPPGCAQDCVLDIRRTMHSYGSRWAANSSKWFTKGFLWPLENMVYAHERARIIAEVLHELPKSRALGPKEPEKAWEFLHDFNLAMQATEDKWRLPKPKSSRKMQIKRISDYWWLFHRSWMPLCFDTFEEAAGFARKYVVKEKPKMLISVAR